MGDTSIFSFGIAVGVVLALFVWNIGRRLLSIRGYWTGTWYEIIPQQHGIPQRVDCMRLWQIGHVVWGHAYRIEPPNEAVRRWYFRGYSTESIIIGFFHLVDPNVDPASFIPVTLTRDPHPRTVSVWRGYYTWPALSPKDEILNANERTGAVIWQKHKPELST